MLLPAAALLHVVLHAQVLQQPPRLVIPQPAANVTRATAHQNREPAGRLQRNTLTLSVDIVESAWRPEGTEDPEVPILAFAESGRTPTVPGPLIRVRRGTNVALTLRNRSDSTIVLHGLRPGAGLEDDTLRLAAGSSREVRYTLDAVGTFYYFGALDGLGALDRLWKDSQLNGAIVVDAPGAPTDDRILLMSEWFFQPPNTRHFESALVINGRGWPHTATMEFTHGDSVRFRVINLIALPHPMHLHGFFYRIESRGDGRRDVPVPAEARQLSNTDLIGEGETYTLSFEASMPGNWLYHCHFASHIDETASLSGAPTSAHAAHTAPGRFSLAVPMPASMEHMRGLVIGLKVNPRPGYVEDSKAGARVLHLYAQERPGFFPAGLPLKSYVLQHGDSAPAPDSTLFPSSVIELERGKPVRIVVHNNLREPTAVHWHGLEIESFPDGVPNWSGLGDKVFTQIAPRDSFAAEFTPTRAGTYPYHTHFNDRHQMTSGLYGALLVLDAPRDLTRDHLVVIGGRGPWLEAGSESPYGAVNGGTNPRPLRMIAGQTQRLRIVSLHPDWPVTVTLQNDSTVARWTAIAKDGADLPPALRLPSLARTRMGPGETADFEFTPAEPGAWVITVQAMPGGFVVTQRIVVTPSSP